MQVPDGPLTPNGWAVECRITSEDPGNGFLPSTGRLDFLHVPAGPGVRWDSGFEVGNEVTLHYDSMVAKLIVWGRDRPEALRRMVRALDELVIVGIASNQGFQRRLVTDPAFVAGDIDIQFLDRRPDLAEAAPPADTHARGRHRRRAGGRRGPARAETRHRGVGRCPLRLALDGPCRGAALSGPDEAPVRILRIATGGDGVGTLGDGRTVFVPRTAAGDLVTLRRIKLSKTFARAEVGELLEPSPDRVEPACPHYGRDQCGGCQLQHLALPAQLAAKRAMVGEALRRIGKVEVEDPDIEAAEMAWGYRNKVTLTVSEDARPSGFIVRAAPATCSTSNAA